jgi:hypothetical protein
LTPSERELLDSYLGLTPSSWAPLAGPQLLAYLSLADILFYGGAAGGGKTDLILGLVLLAHVRSMIFRREFPQLRGIIDRFTEIRGGSNGFNQQTGVWRLGGGRTLELASVPRIRDAMRFQGRPHDLKAFDEITHFTEDQFRMIIGWNRTADPTQRTRVVCTGNPPLHPEEEWVIRFFAPWLDPEHANPAQPGELRWFAVVDGRDLEVEGPAPFMHKGDELRPMSRTFIPARVEDNPFLMASGYKTTLQNLPEPLRTAMLKGIFGQKGEDNPWQCIPTAWIDLAMARWEEHPAPPMALTALGVDVARGGKDKTCLAPRRGTWFGHVECHDGKDTPNGPSVAALVITALGGSNAPVNIDIIGVGGSAYDSLTAVHGMQVNPMVGSEKSEEHDRSGRLSFNNKRAEWYWRLREALDPDHGLNIALPPDRELRVDLAAPRWRLTTRGIQIELKEEIAKRIGRSPDKGDAVVYSFAKESNAMSILDAMGSM